MPPFKPTGEMFELHSLCRSNLLKSSYISGLHIIDDDGMCLYFSGGRIDGDSLMHTLKNLQLGYFSIFIDFEEDWSAGSIVEKLNAERQYEVTSLQSVQYVGLP